MLIQCLEQLIQYFNGQRRKFELPIHQQGSAFQQGVWAELMAIPFGKTISYIELAVFFRDLGMEQHLQQHVAEFVL